MGLHSAAGALHKHARERYPVPFHDDIDIEVGNAQEQIAHDATDEIHRESHLAGNLTDCPQRITYLWWQPFLDQAFDDPGGAQTEIVRLGDICQPFFMQRTEK